MVPGPIALLSLFYGVIATIAAASIFKILAGASTQSLIWPLLWFGLAAGAMCGLPLLKSWARRVAIAGSIGMSLLMLGVAASYVSSAHPLAGLLTALLAGTHILIIRYLRRPDVKGYFVT